MINICGKTFYGPYYIEESIEEKSGVYLVVSPLGTVIDVGETGNLQNRLKTHDRKDQWKRRLGHTSWCYWVSYMPENERMKIEKALRSYYPNLCGKR